MLQYLVNDVYEEAAIWSKENSLLQQHSISLKRRERVINQGLAS